VRAKDATLARAELADLITRVNSAASALEDARAALTSSAPRR
jgi:hypothetical protein